MGAWTPEREKLLTDLWAAGTSGNVCAHKLGISKNAVIGKVHRLGLPIRETRIRLDDEKRLARINGREVPMEAPVMPRQRAKAGQGKPRARPRKTECIPVTQPSPTIDFEPQPLPRPCSGQKPLLDLATGECRWPSGEGTIAEPFTFCAAQQADGSSYCETHREEAHRSYASSQGGFYRRTA